MQTPAPIPVVLLHRHAVVREAVQLRLDAEPGINVVASVATPAELLRAVDDTPTVVVLMEQQTPGPDGLSLVADLRAVAPGVRMVMLVDSDDLPVVVGAVRAGVAGIVRSHTPPVVLVDTVRAVADGAAVLDLDALQALAASWDDSPKNPLSMREREVLACLARGLTNAEAAARLYVSRETVKTHVAHVLRKLEVDDRAAAVDKATRLGLLGMAPRTEAGHGMVEPPGPDRGARHHLAHHETRRTTCEF